MVVGSLRTTTGVVVARGEKVVTAVAVVTRVVVILSRIVVVVGKVGRFVVV